MARLLIVYASKTGTAKDIAKGFAKTFESSCDLYDCKNQIITYSDMTQEKKAAKDIRVQDYEIVLSGSAMYIGKPLKEFIHFCKMHENELQKKKLILFTCGMETQEKEKEYLWNCLPEGITKSASLYLHLGGEIRLDKMGFFSRMAMKEFTKQQENIPAVNQTNIDEISKKITEYLSAKGEK